MSTTLTSLQSHYLTFHLGDDLYAVPIGAVQELRGPAPTEPLQDVADYIPGGLRHAGVLVPLLDLRCRLGLAASTAAGPAVTVVVHASDRQLGIVVDAVADVVDLGVPAEALVSAHPGEARAGLAYLKGAVALDERMVLVLDLDQLVNPAHVAALDAALAATTATDRCAG